MLASVANSESVVHRVKRQRENAIICDVDGYDSSLNNDAKHSCQSTASATSAPQRQLHRRAHTKTPIAGAGHTSFTYISPTTPSNSFWRELVRSVHLVVTDFGNLRALGNHFSTGVQGQKSRFIMLRDTPIFTPPLEIVLLVRQVINCITLTPVRHKRHIQYLTSAPIFFFWGGG